MNKILPLSVENLKIPEEMAYYYFVIQAVNGNVTIKNRFATPFSMFEGAYDEQNTLYLRHDRKILTQVVQDKEVERDKWIRKLRNNLREIVDFGSGIQQENAEFLLTIVDEYGGAKIPDMTYEAETGVLLNLYEDLQELYPEKVESLGLTSVVASAKQANDEFIEALNRRTQSDADYKVGAMAEARAKTVRMYRYFIDCVNVEAEIDTAGTLNPFIDYMNAKINEMRHLAGQGTASSGSGTGEEGDDVVRTKKAKFTFKSGTTVTFNVEVGTPLIAPSNTEGYEWKPAVPELMPNQNKTFREVAIDPEKVTALFHFIDHREEEIKQAVGTELTAPANTEGYVWEPEVPAVMPAEDTSYYEMPAPDNGGGNSSGGSGSNQDWDV